MTTALFQFVDRVHPCLQLITVHADSLQSNTLGRIGISIVNRPSRHSDETLQIRDHGKVWDTRKDLIHFPIVSTGRNVELIYTRSHGPAQLIVLLFYQDGSFIVLC